MIITSPPAGGLAGGVAHIVSFLSQIFFAQRTGRLDMSGTGMTVVPPEVTSLTKLSKLKLADNKISVIPVAVGLMTGLVELNMSNNLITEIPSDIGHAISLTELNLGGNAITRLPIEIGLLTNLTYLEVDQAQLTLPPKEIVQSGTTQVVNYLRQICQSKESGNLILDTQGLWSLPDEVTALPNLVTLSMRENQLVVLPSTISKLTTLTELMLSNNQLGSFLTRCPRR